MTEKHTHFSAATEHAPTPTQEALAILKWLREPDHAEEFSLMDFTNWVNRRPVAEMCRVALSQPEQEPAAWQYRFNVGGWLPWHELDSPIDWFRQKHQFNLENGTCELRPLYAAQPPASPPSSSAGNASEVLTEIIDYFANSDESAGGEWAHPDDFSSYCLDFQGRDGVKFWLDLEKDGTIHLMWKRGEAIKSMNFGLIPTEPQPSADSAALARRFWSIHPSELDDLGLTREEFYASEMTKLLASEIDRIQTAWRRVVADSQDAHLKYRGETDADLMKLRAALEAAERMLNEPQAAPVPIGYGYEPEIQGLHGMYITLSRVETGGFNVPVYASSQATRPHLGGGK